MGVISKMGEQIRKGIRSWLRIEDASPYAISIQRTADFELCAIRNRIWYIGDSDELQQMYMQNPVYADREKFWASRCTPGMEMRKIHTGLPGLIVRTLCSIVIPDMQEFEFTDKKYNDVWEEIAKDSDFVKLIEKALKETLAVGDGAFKVSVDRETSEYPIIEWYPGERVEIVRKRGRIREIVFKTALDCGGRRHVLHEKYGYGYVRYCLYRDDKEIPLDSLDVTRELENITFDKRLLLAVPLMVFENPKFEGRGASVFEGKLDSFDAFDEVFSQWMDALRQGRAKTYIPENLIPRNPKTSEIMKPNAFDNRFIAVGADMTEGAKNVIDTEQPAIPHDSYIATYTTALDLCLQGVISPCTLGVDTKKLDNALAQREKEKTTLYTRDAIIAALQPALIKLAAACVNANNLMHSRGYEEIKVSLDWGEYANPSFESQIETIAKARQGGIMSIEMVVDELYGANMDDECKAEEVARLKAEQGIVEMEEPALNLDGVSITQEGAAAGNEGA